MAHKMVPREKKRYVSCIKYVPDDCIEWTDAGYVITNPEKVKECYDEVCAYLDNQRIQCCISPLHDRDKYDKEGIDRWVKNHVGKDGMLSPEDEKRKPDTTKVKKPHWHILTYSKGGRTIVGMNKLFGKLGINAFWVEDDAYSAKRYQAHIDSPTKARYDEHEIRAFGGMQLDELWEVSKAGKLDAVEAICKYIKEYECTNFYDLTNAMFTFEDVALFEALVSRTTFFINYMKGLAERLSTEEKLHEH